MTLPARDCRGFTLVEVLIALSLLGITMATVVALFSSGMQLRAVTREHLAFQRDARMLVEALRDDLANVSPAGPRPMITADSIVLCRRGESGAEPTLVTYQWSGSADQDSLLVRVSTPLVVDPADFAGVEREFRRWARIFDPTVKAVQPLIREDHSARFGPRASLDGLAGPWVAYPTVRAVAWGLGDVPGADDGESTASRILVRISPVAWRAAHPVPDPEVRLALMPDDGSCVDAALWLPVAAQVPIVREDEQAEGGTS